jgi:O-antigen/teichoic acid export membrane protein
VATRAVSTRTLRDLGGRALGALRSPLYGSGYALLTNVAGTTAIGLVYWAVAAHLYSAQSLGRNSALISALLLVSNFAQLNLHSTLPRFLPRAGRSAYRLVTYSYGVSALAALAVGVAFVTILPQVNSNWRFVGESVLLAVLFAAGTVLWGVFNLEDAALVGLHRSVVVPVENTLYGVAKLVTLLAVAVALPATGIFVSWVVPLVVIIPAINWLIFRRYLTGERYAAAAGLRAREVLRFASIDYVGAAIGQGAWNLLPLLVLSALGAAANGNFYIAFTLASGLTLVTANFSYSMLAEGAKAPHRLPELTRGVLLRCAVVTLPAVAVMVVAAGPILSIYGPGYAAHGSVLLGLLALTAIPTGLITIAFSLDRLAGRVGRASLTQGIRAALILGGSWLLMGHLGINGVGLACVAGSLVVALVRLPTVIDAARRRTAPARTPEPPSPATAPEPPVAGPAQAGPRRFEDADTFEFAAVVTGSGGTDTGGIAAPARFAGLHNDDFAAPVGFADAGHGDVAAPSGSAGTDGAGPGRSAGTDNDGPSTPGGSGDADTDEFAAIPDPVTEEPPAGGAGAAEPSAVAQAFESSRAAVVAEPSTVAQSAEPPGVIGDGATVRHAPAGQDARRRWPAAAGYLLIAALQLIVLVRYPHRFEWSSAWGIVYLIFLGMMLLAGAVGLARGLPRAANGSPWSWLRRQPKRGWPARTRWRIVSALAAVVFAVGAGTIALSNGGSGRGGEAARHPALPAAVTARQQAAAWVASQVSPAAIVGCDPVMCATLLGRHVVGRRLLVLSPGRTSPLRSDVVVATPAVRHQFGPRLASVYAPVVLATFGSGTAQVEIRAVAPAGAAAYRAELAADVRARRSAGAVLLDSPRIHVAAAARMPLADGEVDPRLLVTLATVAARHQLDILGFSAAGHGASAGVPLRTADITWAARPGGRPPVSLPGMRAILTAQRPPYRPSSIQAVQAPPGHTALRITYPAPSPLGLLGPAS